MTDLYEIFEKIILGLLVLFILFLPYSIYLSQSAVHMAMIMWLLKIFCLPLKEKLWIKTSIDLPLFFLLVVVGTTFFGRLTDESLIHGFRFIRSYRHIFVLFLVVNNIRRKENLKILVYLTCLGAAVHAVWSCFRYYHSYQSGYADGFGSFTESILYMHVAITCIMLMFLKPLGARRRWIITATAIFTTAALIVNHQYEVWSGFFLALSLVFLSVKMKFAAILTLIITVFLCVFLVVINPGMRSLSGDAISVVTKYPMGSVESTKNLLKSMGYRDSINHFKNDYLQTGVVSGIFGLFALIWFMFSYLGAVLKSINFRDKTFKNAVLISGFSLCIGFLLIGFFEGPLELSKNMMCLFFFMGVSLNVVLGDKRVRDMDNIAKQC